VVALPCSVSDSQTLAIIGSLLEARVTVTTALA
jgi:hypothetical protein